MPEVKVVVYGGERDPHISEMEDGDIAEITHWNNADELRGAVVQRNYNSLIPLGLRGGQGWTDLFENLSPDTDIRVRILRPGTVLKLT